MLTQLVIPSLEEVFNSGAFPLGHSRASGNLRQRSVWKNRGSRLRGNDVVGVDPAKQNSRHETLGSLGRRVHWAFVFVLVAQQNIADAA
jgi:hypothetical protein